MKRTIFTLAAAALLSAGFGLEASADNSRQVQQNNTRTSNQLIKSVGMKSAKATRAGSQNTILDNARPRPVPPRYIGHGSFAGISIAIQPHQSKVRQAN